ncbi:unnamed protein product [Protopolystoma xenopodis]|uniref:Uncharacterized protein n=1 Tax=Protopolystoma xenopodis TaxID=117903 RepID=A0A448X645_9PLAT|nr:unnamed protein product [Protopolystoma xenopodis]
MISLIFPTYDELTFFNFTQTRLQQPQSDSSSGRGSAASILDALTILPNSRKCPWVRARMQISTKPRHSAISNVVVGLSMKSLVSRFYAALPQTGFELAGGADETSRDEVETVVHSCLEGIIVWQCKTWQNAREA